MVFNSVFVLFIVTINKNFKYNFSLVEVFVFVNENITNYRT